MRKGLAILGVYPIFRDATMKDLTPFLLGRLTGMVCLGLAIQLLFCLVNRYYKYTTTEPLRKKTRFGFDIGQVIPVIFRTLIELNMISNSTLETWKCALAARYHLQRCRQDLL